jgi:hypothetical protein
MMQSVNGALKHLAGPALIESRATAGGLYLGEAPKLPRGVASDVLPVLSLEASVDAGQMGALRQGLTRGHAEPLVDGWATPCAARRLTPLAV